MKNEMLIFNNEKFGNIRAKRIDGNPWFVGIDVATALGYSNASKAVSSHVDEDDKRFILVESSDSQNGNLSWRQVKTAFINESGLYGLIFSSKLDSAKKFKHWVTSEVLPSLRKDGTYSIANAKEKKPSALMLAHEETIRALRELNDCQKELLVFIKEENARLKNQSNAYVASDPEASRSTVKAEVRRENIKLNDFYKQLAKEGLKMSVNDFYSDLNANGYIEKGPTGVYRPTKSSVDSKSLIPMKRKYNGAEYIVTVVPPETQDLIRVKYIT